MADIHYTVAKCKLKNIVRHPEDLEAIERTVVLIHEAVKRAYLFLKAYSLHCNKMPKIEQSTLVQCLNKVTSKRPIGKKPKDSNLSSRFSGIKSSPRGFQTGCPSRSSACSRPWLAKQIILVDTSTRFKSRLSKLLWSHLGRTYNGETLTERKLKVRARVLAGALMSAMWEQLPEELTKVARRVLPPCPRKGSYQYGMKCNPSRYIRATYHICREMGEDCDFTFLPLRTSNMPCHTKSDTKIVSQIYVPPLQRGREDEEGGSQQVTVQRSCVGENLLIEPDIQKNSRNFEIVTDGVSASMGKKSANGAPRIRRSSSSTSSQELRGMAIGVDPGRKSIMTMVNKDSLSLRYTTRQRNFESSLKRFREGRKSFTESIRWQAVVALRTIRRVSPST